MKSTAPIQGFQGKTIRDVGKNEGIAIHFTLPLNIGPGDYSLTAAIHPDEYGHQGHFDWVDKALSFQVLPSEPKFIGFSKLDPTITVFRGQEKENGEGENPLNQIFPEAPSQLEMDDRSEKYLMKGWHSPELWEGGTVRWTRKECLFVMRTKGSGSLWLAEALTRRGMKVPLPVKYTETARRSDLWICLREGRKVSEFPLLPELRNQVVRLKIVLSGTWSPDHFYHNGDKRELGIYVKKIWSE